MTTLPMTTASFASNNILYTIGHSNHSIERFLELLEMHEITVIADVRSIPQSRFSPQFNQKNLIEALTQIDCRYIFFGKELGGKRHEKECLVNGQIDDEWGGRHLLDRKPSAIR